ncbi:hypothetical protein chiPu_0017761 [Chiloscyllium punctatum]|uniref:Uncharacterized protein n=1 Tax=Chiloscyllium punctatum TaxID=137246 RepID=A0A401RIP5_CHIPU|nr:hypothetical protein [Chiloscyllium punctatum]
MPQSIQSRVCFRSVPAGAVDLNGIRTQTERERERERALTRVLPPPLAFWLTCAQEDPSGQQEGLQTAAPEWEHGGLQLPILSVSAHSPASGTSALDSPRDRASHPGHISKWSRLPVPLCRRMELLPPRALGGGLGGRVGAKAEGESSAVDSLSVHLFHVLNPRHSVTANLAPCLQNRETKLEQTQSLTILSPAEMKTKVSHSPTPSLPSTFNNI